MAWNDIIESNNEWNTVDYNLYVLTDYWVDGYTDDLPNTWTEQSDSSNTWTVIG